MELNALSESLTGLEANQTYLNVVGNNIANINTTAYKTQDISFQTLMAQTLNPGTQAITPSGATSPTLEGTNPYQIGVGVGQGTTSTNNAQGTIMSTGIATNLAIQGGGYFVLSNGSQPVYTRDGSFTLAPDGALESSSGMMVQGWTANNGTITTSNSVSSLGPIKIVLGSPEPGSTATPPPTLSSFSIGPDGTITGVYTDGTSQALAQVAMATFPNADGLQQDGGNVYSPGVNSGAVQIGTANAGQFGAIASGQLEGSNVHLSSQFAQMIQAQQGFNANSKIVTTVQQMLQQLISAVQ